MPISVGTYYIGEGWDYDTLKDACDDVQFPLLGTLRFILTKVVYHPLKATLNGGDFSGNSIILSMSSQHNGIPRQGDRFVIPATNSELIDIQSCQNGSLVLEKINVEQEPAVAVGPSNRMINVESCSSFVVRAYDCIFRGGQRGQTCIRVAATSGGITLYTNEFIEFNDPGSTGDGYALEETGGTSLIELENTSFHRCGTGVRVISGTTGKLNNNIFLENDFDFIISSGGPSNSITGKKNSTDKTGAFGFNSESGTQNEKKGIDNYVSLDPDSFSYFRMLEKSALKTIGVTPEILQNNYGIRNNLRGVDGTFSIGPDEFKALDYIEIRQVPPQATVGGMSAGVLSDLATIFEDTADAKGSLSFRFYVLDHGRTNPNDPIGEQNWIDFTEINGVHRLKRIPSTIKVGTEGTKPFRFEANTINLQLDNGDFVFDNLKSANLIYRKSDQIFSAKFLSVPNGTSIDLQNRPLKITAVVPKEFGSVEYELGHYRIQGLRTDTKGTANMKIVSLEKEFIEKEASTVKDGKNWYFDRSFKFLAEQLIKSVRSEVDNGAENLKGKDSISISDIETNDGQRVYSEFGRPIAEVKPLNPDLKNGEKRLIVTAAAVRNIFRGKLLYNYSAGVNEIEVVIGQQQIGGNLNMMLRKGDVITIGKASGSSFDDLNEEKATVLQDVSIVSPGTSRIEISGLKKDHVVGEEVHRWILYLGCTKDIEDDNESYLVSFDPDRDEYGWLASLDTPPRFIHINQIFADMIPGEIAPPITKTLIVMSSYYSFPGRPNEQGKVIAYRVEQNNDWNDPNSLVQVDSKELLSSDGGLYTGEFDFRSLKPLATTEDIGVNDLSNDSLEIPNYYFGAYAVGKFVESVIEDRGITSLGFGYLAGLSIDAIAGSDTVQIGIIADGGRMWAIHPVTDSTGKEFGGTLFLIGIEENFIPQSDQAISETFGKSTILFSSRILETQRYDLNVVQYKLQNPLETRFFKNNTVAVVVPDSGKMYVRNKGENLLVPESQNVTVQEFMGDEDTQETRALDSDLSLPVVYEDKIKFERKGEIDSALQTATNFKKKLNTKSLDKGYYGVVLERKKMTVDRGDVIGESVSALSNNIRIVPGQYTAHPFANELWNFYIPETPYSITGGGQTQISGYHSFPNGLQSIIGDRPPVVFEGPGSVDKNGNTENVNHPLMKEFVKDEFGSLKNRNIHVWNYPVIGLWAKYEKQNDSLFSFDGSVISQNGNAEMLGYWYLSYETDNVPTDAPKIQVAVSDAEGYVKLVDFSDLQENQFPLCSVLHNMTVSNGPGINGLDFYGDIGDVMLSRIVQIVGGDFTVFPAPTYKTIFGAVAGERNPININYYYLRWVTAGTKFEETLPLNMNVGSYPFNNRVVLKFKKLRDPQAKGSLFTGLHCYPVRIRHLHLPYGDNTDLFNGEVEVTLNAPAKPGNIEPPTENDFTYTGKTVDTNFSNGSEELLNYDPVLGFNPWVLDRYSQGKTLGMVVGAADEYSNSGILKGASLKASGSTSYKQIEIPVGYRGTVDEQSVLNKQADIDTNSWAISNFQSSLLGQMDAWYIDVFTTSPHTLDNADIGCLLKLDGSKEFSPPINYQQTLDGIYELLNVFGATFFRVKYVKKNESDGADNPARTSSTLQAFISKGSFKKYYGRDLEYSDADVRAAYNSQFGTVQLRVTGDGSRYPLASDSEYGYGVSNGKIRFSSEEDANTHNLIWDGNGVDPAEITGVQESLEKVSGSGPDLLPYVSIYNAPGQSPGVPTMYEEQNVDHRDFLFRRPVGEIDPPGFDKTVLSYSKTFFNCIPSYGSILNYPKALYGKSWDSFWKYQERVNKLKVLKKEGENAVAAIYPQVNTELDDYRQFVIHLKSPSIGTDEPFDGSAITTATDLVEVFDDMAEYINANSSFYSAVSDTAENGRPGLFFFCRENVSALPNNVFNTRTIEPTQNNQLARITLDTGGVDLATIWNFNTKLYLFTEDDPNDGSGALMNNLFLSIVRFETPTRILAKAYYIPNFELSFIAGFLTATVNPGDSIIKADAATINQLVEDQGLILDAVFYRQLFKIENLNPGAGEITVSPNSSYTFPTGVSIYSEPSYSYRRDFSVYDFFYKVSELDTTNVYLEPKKSDGDYSNMGRYTSVRLPKGGSLGFPFGIGEENPYGEGDGDFDSEIKPLEFGDAFIKSMAKWYLSRYDEGDKILCDTYTVNHNGPFLDDDDNLFAIVNRHPELVNNLNRFPFVKTSLGTQKNFLAHTGLDFSTDTVFFSRSKFKVIDHELQIQSSLWKYRNRSTSGYQFEALKQGEFPLIPIDNTDDWLIHGIFKHPSLFQENEIVNFGLMRWVNDGTVHINRIFSSYDDYYPQHRFFSRNLIAYAQSISGDGAIYALGLFDNGINPIVGSIYNQQNTNFFKDIGGIKQKEIYELPTLVRGGGTLLSYTTSDPPGSNQWTYIYNHFKKTYTIKIGPSSLPIYFGFKDVTVSNSNQFKSDIFDLNNNMAYLFLIKRWTDEIEPYSIQSFNKESVRGSVMRRHNLLSENKTDRDAREDICVVHIEESESSKSYFENVNSILYNFGITDIRKFSFKVGGSDGYYFLNNFDNSLRKWNGESINNSPVVENLVDGFPVVEGDFNEYERMVKIDSPYEEVFGFSMGPRAHIASQSFQGGRNIIWKLSKSLAFHIAVADFSNLSVWDALTNFAELADCVIGFDRRGNFHFEKRPNITSESIPTFTFDAVDGNILDIVKKPAFQHAYNQIEIVPFKPVLPDVTVNLATQSEEQTVNANHDLFVRDISLDFSERSQTKARPNIQAYQKDFKRKRILLICTNGQFDDEDSEAKGIYSRFKYQIIENSVSLRLVQDLIAGETVLKSNNIPFDSLRNNYAFKINDYILIGDAEYKITDIDSDNREIHFTPAVPSGTRYDIGTPFTIVNSEEIDGIFFAEGSGEFPTQENGIGRGFTYSPKPYFVEIGEWAFDEKKRRQQNVLLAADIGPASSRIPLTSIEGFRNEGSIVINGEVISYSGIEGKALIPTGSISTDFAKGLRVLPMPDSPQLGVSVNLNYIPGKYRLGGYDEVGPSCLNEYHLLDPNEDGQPYFNADPNSGGKPITALEFYSSDQELISYADERTLPSGNPTGTQIITNDDGSTNYRVRNRTYVSVRIDFQGFRFNDGDKIELDVPGIQLKAQDHLKQIFNNPESIKRNGLRQFPSTNNRFFNAVMARVFGKRNLNRLSRIGNELIVRAKIEDIDELKWNSIIRVRDNRIFSSYPNNSVLGYVSQIHFDQKTKEVEVQILTQED